MNHYKKFVKKGVRESFSKIPFHTNVPIKRLSMLSKKLVPTSNTHVAIHIVDYKHKKLPEYSFLHNIMLMKLIL